MTPPASPPPARPVYLTSGAERVFALFHEAPAAAGHSAVLLCPPFGWEDICSYRSRRDWAEQLALAGHPTLRIDLPGSGDSPGGPSDPGRPAAWGQAIQNAGEWLRSATGAPSLTVVGIGLSGLLAARGALEGASIDQLVLWAAPTRGRSLIRELRAFSRLELANVVGPGEELPAAATAPAEGLTANGYRMSGETVCELEALDLCELPRRTCSVRRALLIGRDALGVAEGLRTLLENAGIDVTLAPGTGFEAMMLEPQDARAPTEVFATVGGWLAAGPHAERAPANAAVAATVPGDAELRLPGPLAGLRERPLYLQRPEGRLLGILTEPLEGSGELCAVLLNAGPQRHTGPNRMWVEIARRWASRGVPTLRIDLAGIGDSDGDSAALVRVSSLYTPAYIEQARAVLDMLEQEGLPRRVLLLGLCAGAHWALHAALQDERVTGVVMLNPRALVWDEWDYTKRRTRDLRERFFLPSTWRRVLRGEVAPARHLETARSIAGRALSAPQRVALRAAASRRAQAPERDPGEALFDRLRERDQHALLLLTGQEPLRLGFQRSGLLSRLHRWPNLELVLAGTSADTHTLTPLWLQAEVHELVDRALEAELRRLAAGPSEPALSDFSRSQG